MRLLAAALVACLIVAAPAARQAATIEPESLMTTPVLLVDGARAVSQGTGLFRPGKASANASTQEPTPDISLQLGYVWKAAVIADMARHYRPR